LSRQNRATMHTESVSYSDAGRAFVGYAAYEESAETSQSRRPCVLVSHAWGGQGDFERTIAQRLAQLGYVGFALDLYGEGVRGNPSGDNGVLIQPFMDDRMLVRRRMLAAVAAVKRHPLVDPESVGAIGYCFGGLCVLDLARSADSGVKCVVSFHGMLHAPKLEEPQRIAARVLVLHGFDDPLATPHDVLELARELTEAQADWQIHAYGRVGHAFALPGTKTPDERVRYDSSADRRSWLAMKHFLEEAFAS
jgi:dienelactone hydrolase